VFRHGDRTPKQKMKMITTDARFLAFFKGKKKGIKLKHPRELQKILQIAQENV
jgi:inositol-hexakisphosphate/diphosphoinositol-pentakisphosphate 1-kinase